MKTTKTSASAAVHGVDPDRWWDEFGALPDRIRPRIARYEPARLAGCLMQGLLSGLERKNCWTIAEHLGHSDPEALPHLLSRAKWDDDGACDDLLGYVLDAFNDPAAVYLTYTAPQGHALIDRAAPAQELGSGPRTSERRRGTR